MKKEESRRLSGEVLAGMIGGLLFYGAQLTSEEFINQLSLPNNFWFKLFIPLVLAFAVFIVFALTLRGLSKK